MGAHIVQLRNFKPITVHMVIRSYAPSLSRKSHLLLDVGSPSLLQDELITSLAANHYKLLCAPADGACFFHSLQLAGATDKSVEELRKLVDCPHPQEASSLFSSMQTNLSMGVSWTCMQGCPWRGSPDLTLRIYSPQKFRPNSGDPKKPFPAHIISQHLFSFPLSLSLYLFCVSVYLSLTLSLSAPLSL